MFGSEKRGYYELPLRSDPEGGFFRELGYNLGDMERFLLSGYEGPEIVGMEFDLDGVEGKKGKSKPVGNKGDIKRRRGKRKGWHKKPPKSTGRERPHK